jgi:uncharacterized protein (DUF3820 family)
MKNNLMPFGKYNGMTLEEIHSVDPEYFKWLCTQNWFKEKFDSTYNLIVNVFNPQKNECSPEHNKLQSLFLNNNIKLDIVKKFLNTSFLDLKIYDNNSWEKILENYIKPKIEFYNTSFEKNGFDVFFRAGFVTEEINFKDLRSLINSSIDFKDLNFKILNIKGYEIIKRTDEYIKIHYYNALNFYIEIKPNIGDDFPNILRQIKKNKSLNKYIESSDIVILAYNNFSVSNLTFEEVESFFNTERIYLYKINKEN